MEEVISPKTCIDKGFIDLDDNIAFRLIKDGCNCFGHNYKGYQRGGASHPYEPDVLLWFPKINAEGVWDNQILDNGNLIIERCTDENLKAKYADNYPDEERKNKRIAFVRDRDEFGELMYIFKGLYELDKIKSNAVDGTFWNRIATRVKTYQPHAN